MHYGEGSSNHHISIVTHAAMAKVQTQWWKSQKLWLVVKLETKF